MGKSISTFLFCGLLLFAGKANAHEVRPAIVDLEVAAPGRITLAIGINLEAVLAGIGTAHQDTGNAAGAQDYQRLRALAPALLAPRFAEFSAAYVALLRLEVDRGLVPLTITQIDIPPVGDTALSRLTRLRLEGEIPAHAPRLRWTYPARFGDSILRVHRPGAPPVDSYWLAGGQASDWIRVDTTTGQRPTTALVIDYLGVGFTHILPLGYDHLLFVLGLLLLSNRLRPLLWQISAFTLAHSLTLALTLFDVISLPPVIVEALIAASIVYVGIENLVAVKPPRWRTAVVFGFGLLHGMGFAGILLELQLGRAERLGALLGFNLGVELGQLLFLLIAWLPGYFLLTDAQRYRRYATIPGSLAIALAGLLLGWSRMAGF